ncbi:unnamed protein product [Meganyctiphanes norvegica]|uniref:Spaetzle domain-containing protein n=1 Tax=Meganyctiphanes norvegica TaxID=48144 RepID=A0AAV2QHI3_MEGNR
MAFQHQTLPNATFIVSSTSNVARQLFTGAAGTAQGSQNFLHHFGQRATGGRSFSGASAPNQQIELLKDPSMNDKKLSQLLVPSASQGPVAVRSRGRGRGQSTPVRPKLSLPNPLANSTFMQLPVLWTALSLALGVEVNGEIIRGVPCIKRLNQLFCNTPGNNYPAQMIEKFIEDNKALMRRMYGEFRNNAEVTVSQIARSGRQGRSILDNQFHSDFEEFNDLPPILQEFHADDPRGEEFFSLIRSKRQSGPGATPNDNSDKVDSCQSKVEIVRPYWASNSKGKVFAVVNTGEFTQAIHQEVCARAKTTKWCGGECSCDQKYKWHRMLAYDPDDDCRGIFMDWFLFPSCCVCRCNNI